MLFVIIIFALSMNIDAFIVGLNYGIAGKNIAIKARFLMVLATGIALSLSMVMGNAISLFMPGYLMKIIPGVILIGLGIMIIWKTATKKENKGDNEVLWQLRIPSLGVMINILADPESCDGNHDNQISGIEALFLGFALAMDSFGAGFSFGIGDFSIILVVSIVMLIKYLLLSIALYIGSHMKITHILEEKFSYIGPYIPGIFFIVFGAYSLIFS